MSIILTKKQEEGLKIAIRRYLDGEKYTVISGYAGTGKSTLVKFITSSLPGIDPDIDVVYATFTGKAAQVLMSKGNQNAMTLHRLLYESIPRPDGTFLRKKRLQIEFKVVVVDEVSMAPKDMMEQLFAYHGIYVICLGDPFQLPPINKDADNHLLDNPHIFLDEIMRQAQDSAIIRLSMYIREGKDFRTFPTVSGEVRIIPHKWQFEDENTTLLQASQIICGTNAQRYELNGRIRRLLGRGEAPEPEDKIIGLKNHWDDISEEGNALTNGAIGSIIPGNHVIQTYPKNIAKFKDFRDTDILWADFITDDGDTFHSLPIDYKCLTTNNPSLTGAQEYQLGGYNRAVDKKIEQYGYSANPKLIIPYNFNYGYAITCWKSQGSEYPYVLGYDCAWLKKKDPKEYTKYLYTLVTRAEKAVILVGD